jgi:D-beta-D-heptose 7-phosphate kinase/D-beta-D-heptose 1-phosphate adenosyltransferase
MSEPKILVIGEAFIDKYYVGTATRLSPEAPIPVVAVKEVIQSSGGAGNVSANLATLGATVLLFQPGEMPIKNRLIANGHQIARWDENDTVRPITLLRQEDFAGLDGVIISDYGKGAFNKQAIINLYHFTRKVPYVFVDTKGDPSNFDFDKPVETFFFPNKKEWTAATETYNHLRNVIRTESENGMTHINYGSAMWHTPALGTDIVSVCGAGDTAIAAFAYQYCKTQDVPNAMRFASKACAVVCGKPYTAVASHEEINKIRG